MKKSMLAYFFPIGGGLTDLSKSGQDKRFVYGEFLYYLSRFEKVYLFDYSDKPYNTKNNRIIQVTNKYGLNRILYSVLLPFLNYKIIKKCSVIRVSHLLGMPPAIIAKIFLKKPIVFNYGYDYASFSKMEKKYFREFLFRLLEYISLKFTDGVICTNRKIFNKLKKNTDKVIFIPNRVDTVLFKPFQNKRQGLNQILCVARLEEQKNLMPLIRAVSLLNDNKIKLTLIGSGSKEQELRSEALKFNVNLEIVKHVPNDKLPAWYNKADIFVLPSIKEGSPKVLLEAMACGLICVVSDIPENRELIKDRVNGYVCETDEKSIFEVLNKIKNEPNLDNIKRNARIKIESGYSFKLLMKKEVAFLSTLI